MKINFSLILLFVLFINSCKQKPLTVDKFVYYYVLDLDYDSLENPCLHKLVYFEYNKDHKFKIARSQFYGKVLSPPHGLTSFYEMDVDNKTIELINKTFIDKNYDSTYNEIPDPRSYYFLYKTSDGKKRVITFDRKDFPNQFMPFYNYLSELISTENRMIPIKPFIVDSMVIDIERKIFLKYPPLPSPNIKGQNTK